MKQLEFFEDFFGIEKLKVEKYKEKYKKGNEKYRKENRFDLFYKPSFYVDEFKQYLENKKNLDKNKFEIKNYKQLSLF